MEFAKISIPAVFLITVLISDCRSEKMCEGTSNGMNNVHNENEFFHSLKQRYENCTIVRGNLELAHISYLKAGGFECLANIREITGYLLIAFNKIHAEIPLPNLRLIWGDEKFDPHVQNATKGMNTGNYSIFIHNNGGLKNIYAPQLRAVESGYISIDSNELLCHWKNLDYTQFLGYGQESRLFLSGNFKNCDDADRECHSSCKSCFGKSQSECQKIYRTNCAQQCTNGMCFEPGSLTACCHPDCLGGCDGPTNKNCTACGGVILHEACANNCPSHDIYDARSGFMKEAVKNTIYYQLNHRCVDRCPEGTRIFKESCVTRCPTGHHEENATHCTPCNGPCPLSCTIKEQVTNFNIKDFENCSMVIGSIEILQHTFKNSSEIRGNEFVKTVGLKEEELEVMSHVKIVTGSILIQSDEKLTSLKFLRNLREIRRPNQISKPALEISNNRKLTELSLVNLRKITNGDVRIFGNSELCYTETLPWNLIVAKKISDIFSNMNISICEKLGRRCDQSCNPNFGCWGPGPKMCFECLKWKLGEECKISCDEKDGFYQIQPAKCERCHEKCLTCNGPTERNCTSCKYLSFKNECFETVCPVQNSFLPFGKTECQECHANCKLHGCTGPGNFVGTGGCNKCDYAALFENLTINRCLEVIEPGRTCALQLEASNYFWGTPANDLVEKGVCAVCHPACKTCAAFGKEEISHNCSCKNFRLVNVNLMVECAQECPHENFYVEQIGAVKNCHPCDVNCNGGCYGTTPDKCNSCKSKWIIEENKNVCLSVCPENAPFSDASDECSAINKEASQKAVIRKQQAIIISVASLIFLMLIVATVVAFVLRQRNRRLSKLHPPPEIFEMNPEAKPDLSQLRLIVEFELKMSEKPLGTGAFGVVFKGIWQPQQEKVKVPVAIKVLHDSNPLAQKEMLDEASLMARMSHVNLIRLIGVCFGSRMMLVTPLMPLGNLLDYVQKNRSKIGSVDLLRWCTQIAAGMEHLEKHRMVHRDLAARNVLVQTPYHVRITDFGLSKLLDYGEEELKVYEGRMPIKWLALECISHKRFTHKSDVWAFGITAWEIFTFGEKPYKDVSLKEIFPLLLNGERLTQPKVCTLDIYFILLKCWLVDSDCRPSFADLHAEFASKQKDPGRYLVIEGDQFMRLPPCTPKHRHDLLKELVEDPDVCDSQIYLDDSQILTLPATHSTATGSLLNTNLAPRPSHRNQSTSSHRYASDPLKIRGLGDLDMSSVPSIDLENYLLPDSIKNLDKEHTSSGLYTPVILEGSISSPGLERHAYYNDLAFVQKNAGSFVREKCGVTPDDSSPSCSHHFSSPSTISRFDAAADCPSSGCPLGHTANNPEYLMNFDEAYCSQNRSSSNSPSFGETDFRKLDKIVQLGETAV